LQKQIELEKQGLPGAYYNDDETIDIIRSRFKQVHVRKRDQLLESRGNEEEVRPSQYRQAGQKPGDKPREQKLADMERQVQDLKRQDLGLIIPLPGQDANNSWKDV
jgi:hypothetical protein